MSGINNLGDKNRWVGRVLSYESQKEQLGGDSRGCRYRVAIMGKHPLEGGINDKKIAFAIVSQKTGSGGGGFRRTCKYPPGDIVHGFYNDSEQQQPVIEGSYGRTKGIKYGSGRFDSKSGYFGKNQPGNLTGRDESLEQVNDCLPIGRRVNTGPREIPKEAAAQLGANTNGAPDGTGLLQDPKVEVGNAAARAVLKVSETIFGTPGVGGLQ